MKTITEIIGGEQVLLDINFDLQKCFEEHLTDEHKIFLHLLRVAEEFLQVCLYPSSSKNPATAMHGDSEIFFPVRTSPQAVSRCEAT